jgi:predicted ATP-dependent endonuclease of OLD family
LRTLDTRTISDRWRQRKYEVQFRADGQLFYTFVKDSHDPALIRLEERSQGFQWFFSFDMMFMHESQVTFKGCVILLDEPGLHLHPEAQRDLLTRLEEYAKDNTLL